MKAHGLLIRFAPSDSNYTPSPVIAFLPVPGIPRAVSVILSEPSKVGVRSFIFSDRVIGVEEQPLQDPLSFPLKGPSALLWVKRSKFSQLYTWTTEGKRGDSHIWWPAVGVR